MKAPNKRPRLSLVCLILILVPIFVALASPIIARLLLPDPKSAIIISKESALLIKVFPEEIQRGLWHEKTLFKNADATYRIAIKPSFIAPYIYISLGLGAVVAAIGNFLAWLLYRRIFGKRQ